MGSKFAVETVSTHRIGNLTLEPKDGNAGTYVLSAQTGQEQARTIIEGDAETVRTFVEQANALVQAGLGKVKVARKPRRPRAAGASEGATS